MKIKRILSFLGVLFFFSSGLTFRLEAAVSKDAKYKRKRLNSEIYISPRSLARGNTYITTATDEDAIFLNPALVPQPKGAYYKTYFLNTTLVSSFSTIETVGDIGDFADLIQGGGGKDPAKLGSTFKQILDLFAKWEEEPVSIFGSGFIGTSFKYVSFGILLSGSLDFDSGLDTVNSRKETLRMNTLINVGPALALTYPIIPELIVGSTFKFTARGEVNVQRSLELVDFLKIQNEKLTVKKFTAWDYEPSIDFGIVYKPKIFLNPRFGIAYSNIGDVEFSDRDGEKEFEMEPIRQNLGIGASIHPKLGAGILSVSLDIRDITASYDTSFLSETYLGVEYLLLEMFGASVGLSQGYPSFGLYFTSRFVQVDLGVYTKERELTVGQKPDPRFFLKLTTSI